jgi:hypothetical protein
MILRGKLIERRRHPRVPYGAYVKHIGPSGKTRFCLAKDLSQGGILLQADDPPPVGTKIRLLLVIENEKQSMFIDAEVVRHCGPNGGDPCFGAEFVDLDKQQGDFVATLVNGLADKASSTDGPA